MPEDPKPQAPFPGGVIAPTTSQEQQAERTIAHFRNRVMAAVDRLQRKTVGKTIEMPPIPTVQDVIEKKVGDGTFNASDAELDEAVADYQDSEKEQPEAPEGDKKPEGDQDPE